MSEVPRSAELGELRPDLALQLLTAVVDKVTIAITQAFQARGIASVVLKGPGFAHLLYDHPTERPYTDTDLLIPADQRSHAESILTQLGFARTDRDEDWLGPAPKYARTFQNLRDGSVVDLHWSLAGVMVSPQALWRMVQDHQTVLLLNGQPITVLDQSMTALLVGLHSAHHGTGWSRTLSDLDQAVEKLDQEQWREAAELAAWLGAARPFAEGTRLTPKGEALANHLQLDRAASVEIWLKTNPSSYRAWVVDRLSQKQSMGTRGRTLLQVLFPPPIIMAKFFSLARRGRRGLVLAYLLRPLRLGLLIVPALHEWFRARQAARIQ